MAISRFSLIFFILIFMFPCQFWRQDIEAQLVADASLVIFGEKRPACSCYVVLSITYWCYKYYIKFIQNVMFVPGLTYCTEGLFDLVELDVKNSDYFSAYLWKSFVTPKPLFCSFPHLLPRKMFARRNRKKMQSCQAASSWKVRNCKSKCKIFLCQLSRKSAKRTKKERKEEEEKALEKIINSCQEWGLRFIIKFRFGWNSFFTLDVLKKTWIAKIRD